MSWRIVTIVRGVFAAWREDDRPWREDDRPWREDDRPWSEDDRPWREDDLHQFNQHVHSSCLVLAILISRGLKHVKTDKS